MHAALHARALSFASQLESVCAMILARGKYAEVLRRGGVLRYWMRLHVIYHFDINSHTLDDAHLLSHTRRINIHKLRLVLPLVDLLRFFVAENNTLTNDERMRRKKLTRICPPIEIDALEPIAPALTDSLPSALWS